MSSGFEPLAGRTYVWAHRGASGYAPENTLSAFALAAEAGADGVELDVQLTKDGQLVVCHDETVDRTSNGHGAIRNLDLDRLKQLDFSAGRESFAGTPIPTLAEVFDLLAPTGLVINVELKNSIWRYPGMEQALIAAAVGHQVVDKVIYSSFNHYSVRELIDAKVSPVGLLYSEPLYQPWDYATRIGAQAIHPSGEALRIDPCVQECHDAGVAVNVWTVNRADDLAACFALGVDAVITNYPDVALKVRG